MMRPAGTRGHMAKTGKTSSDHRRMAGGETVRSRRPGVASPDVELRIGTTLAGRPAGFDTTTTQPLVLLGDPGRGKTTAARFITRWWLADTTRHAHVYAARPTEWDDLRCFLGDIHHPYEPGVGPCAQGSCLVVLDQVDPHPGCTGPAMLGLTPAVVTTCGGDLDGPRELPGDFAALGLLPRTTPAGSDLDVCAGQGRLDWPPHTVAIVPDQRGPLDFPCHRWRTLAAGAGASR